MTIYVEKGKNGKQEVYEQGNIVELDRIKGMTIKNAKKLDGKIILTLK